ncbi:MAG: hypothetical protein JSS79_14290 [Bacteroidetes bacterium]|nr:hypothetical protein [Bacteroidota bacterium]
MKTFAIFPTISVFILTFSVLKGQFGFGTKKNLIWSTVTTIGFGGLFIAGLKLFLEWAWILVLSNVTFGLMLVPVLTFTIDGFFPVATGQSRWIRLFGIGLASIIITAGLLGVSIFFALAYNPMDPGPK